MTMTSDSREAWHASPYRRTRDIRERFMEKMSPEPNSGCWLWLGFIAKNGYGRFGIRRTAHWAHRVAYRLFVGDIPDGLDLDHLCRTRCCVNPEHLQAVSRKENLHRSPMWIGNRGLASG